MTNALFPWTGQPCPACKRPISGQAEVELGVDAEDFRAGVTTTVEAKIVGVRVSHDCIPKRTR